MSGLIGFALQIIQTTGKSSYGGSNHTSSPLDSSWHCFLALFIVESQDTVALATVH